MKTMIDGQRRAVRADFKLEVDEEKNEIRIIDEDRGNMSVTNDLERVLCEVAFHIDGSLDDYDILYRDSTGTWGRIICTQHPTFAHTFNVEVRTGPDRDLERRDQMIAEDADREMFGDEHVELGLKNVGDK